MYLMSVNPIASEPTEMVFKYDFAHTFVFISPENIKHISHFIVVEEGRKFLTYFSWAWNESERAILEERTGARSLHSKNFMDKKRQ